MNADGLLRLRNFLRLSAKLFLAAFLAMSVIYSEIAVGGWLQLVFISLLITYRLSVRRVIFFVPDQMLFCLPYFWAAANLGSVRSWPEYWLAGAVALSLVCPVATGISLPEAFLSNRKLAAALFLSFAFLTGFSFLLFKGYAAVDAQLFHTTLLNILAFAAGIPVSLTAFPASAQAFD